MDAPGRFPLTGIRFELQNSVNAANDQNAAFSFDLANRFRYQPFIRSINLTRLQRASKGAGQSTSRRRHNVIERRRVRLQNIWRDFVMFRHRAMDTENHGRRLGR